MQTPNQSYIHLEIRTFYLFIFQTISPNESPRRIHRRWIRACNQKRCYRVNCTEATGRCGQQGEGIFFILSAQAKEGVIVSTSFKGIDCLWSMAVGIALCSLIEHRPIGRCLTITIVEVIAKVQGIPRSRLDIVKAGVSASHKLGLAFASTDLLRTSENNI